jgi:starch-binding outer membrane protein, SusD/RagB family
MNNMKSKVSKIGIILLAVFFSTFALPACEVTDLEPESEFTADTFWKKEGDAIAALSAVYVELKWLAGSQGDWRNALFLVNMGDIRADMIKTSWGSDCCMGSLVDLNNQVVTPDNNYADWSHFYSLINRANGVIHFTPRVAEADPAFTETEMTAIQGEAYFLRALTYFYIARWWKDAPLVLEPVTDAGQDLEIAKSTQEEILDQVEKDLEVALTAGYLQPSLTVKGRATRYAGYALLAEVYLWRGKYAEAAEAAQQAMSGPFALAPNYWANFWGGGNTSEIIFEAHFTGLNNDYSFLAWVGSWEPGFIQLYDRAEPFTKLVQASGDYEEPGQTEYNYTGRGYHGYGQKYWWWADTRVWKWSGVDDTNLKNPLTDHTDFPIYRLADLMLMRAEALNRANGGGSQEAIDLVNAVRARAKVPSTSITTAASMFEIEDVIMNERAIELSVEGKRWFDLIRADKGRPGYLVDKVLQKYPEDKRAEIRVRFENPESWYMPIYRRELQLNPALVQNPYYN